MTHKKADSTVAVEPTKPVVNPTEGNAVDMNPAESAVSPTEESTVAVEPTESVSNPTESSATAVESNEPAVSTTEENATATQETVTIPNTEIAKTTETAIIFKATKPLMKEEFELLSDMVKYENEKTGLKIVLMPFSCEIT